MIEGQEARGPGAAAPRSRRQEMQHRLEGAALELFLEGGYDSVTVEQIAQAASVSRRTFFRHFKTKSDLLVAEARRRYDLVCEEFQRRPRFEPTFTSLCESFVEASAFSEEELARTRLVARLLAEQPAVADELRAGAEPMGDRLTVLVAERLGADPVLDMTPDLMVRLVRSAARSAQREWLARGATTDLVALLHEAFGLIRGARVLERVAEIERSQARAALG